MIRCQRNRSVQLAATHHQNEKEKGKKSTEPPPWAEAMMSDADPVPQPAVFNVLRWAIGLARPAPPPDNFAQVPASCVLTF